MLPMMPHSRHIVDFEPGTLIFMRDTGYVLALGNHEFLWPDGRTDGDYKSTMFVRMHMECGASEIVG